MPLKEITISIATGYDDAQEKNSTWEPSETTLTFGYTGGIIFGEPYRSFLRFQLPIEKDAIIVSAKLKFYSQVANAETFTCNIDVYDTDDMPSLETAPTVPLWNNPVPYTPEAWEVDTWYESPDIKTLVQHIVNRTGWVKNNHIGFKIDEGNAAKGAFREFYAYEGSTVNCAQLYVKYSEKKETLDATCNIQTTFHSSSSVDSLVQTTEYETLETTSAIKKENLQLSVMSDALILNTLVIYPYESLVVKRSVEMAETIPKYTHPLYISIETRYQNIPDYINRDYYFYIKIPTEDDYRLCKCVSCREVNYDIRKAYQLTLVEVKLIGG